MGRFHHRPRLPMIGKLLGGALGLMSGGIFGALLGLYLGHLLDRALPNMGGGSGLLGGGARGDREQILVHCFELLGCVCKADGHVSQAEIQAAEKLLRRLKIDGDRRQKMIRAFNRGKGAGFDIDASTAALRKLCRGRMLWMRLALEIVLTGALADGRLSPEEHQTLSKIAAGLGFRPADFEMLLQMMTGAMGGGWQQAGGPNGTQAPPRRDQLQEAYQALGKTPQASDDELRKAYRRLMSQHHPDKLAAQDMPDELRAQAEERVRQIRSAWDLIKQARGI